MIIKQADFLQSNTRIDKLPQPIWPEYAFVGRSNVGKSSLINALVQRKGLAKISGRPGKTITINHFLINKNWYLVDLPGYGYAKRAQTEREKWRVLMHTYLQKRSNLIYTFILVDVRVEPQQLDLELMQWMGENQLPFVIVFTKTDKLGATGVGKAVSTYKNLLLQQWDELPICILTSSVLGTGRDEILNLIDEQNQSYPNYSTSTNI